MYKRRLREWSLTNKNNRGLPVAALVHMTVQRAAVGKRSRFEVKGKRIDAAELERYVKRKGLTFDQVIAAGQQETSEIAAVIRCLSTPPLSPAMMDPEVFSVPEKLFTNVRNLVRSNYESGSWTIDDRVVAHHKYCSDFVPRYWSVWQNAFHDMLRGLDQPAIIAQIRARLALLDCNMLGRGANDLSELFTFIHNVIAILGFKTTKSLLELMHQTAASDLSKRHPYMACLETVLSLEEIHMKNITAIAWDCECEEAITCIGSFGPRVIVRPARHMALIVCVQLDKKTPTIAEQNLSLLVSRVGRHSDAYWSACIYILSLRMQHGDVQGALELATACLKDMPLGLPNTLFMSSHFHQVISWAHFVLRNLGAAEIHLWEAMEVLIKFHGGWHHPEVLSCVTKLERLINLRNEAEWVEVVSEQKRRIVATIPQEYHCTCYTGEADGEGYDLFESKTKSLLQSEDEYNLQVVETFSSAKDVNNIRHFAIAD